MNAPPARPRDPLVVAPILPPLVRLSLPNMAAMVATSFVAIAETAYVGDLGTPALAGLALVFPMVMLQQMMSGGAMGGGVSSAIARALGAGNPARANALALHAGLIGLTAGLFFALVIAAFGPAIYAALGGRGAALEAALQYSNVFAAGALGIWLTNTLASIVRGGGNMRVPSATLFVAAAAQIVVGGALGLGLGPFPRLGMAGVALGQVAAYCGAALFLLHYVSTGRSRARLTFAGQRLDKALFADILKVGALACASPVQSVATVLIVTRVVAHFGPEALAGYGIGARLEFLLIPIAFAIGVACVPMVGMAIGAGDAPRARRVAWTGGALSAALLGATGVFFALFPQAWSGLFTRDPGALAAAHSYLRLSGPSFAFYGLALCLYFASQGSGRMLGPVLAQTVRLVIVIVGGATLVAMDAPQWQMFAVVGFSLAAYGVAVAAAVALTPWGEKPV